MNESNQFVFCIWEIDGDTVVRIFDSWEKAENWRMQIARDHWEDLFYPETEFDLCAFWDNTTEHGFTMGTVEVE